MTSSQLPGQHKQANMTTTSSPPSIFRIYRAILRSPDLLTDRLEYSEEDLAITYDLTEQDARTLYLLINLHGYHGIRYQAEAIQALTQYAQTHHHGAVFCATVRLIDEIQLMIRYL